MVVGAAGIAAAGAELSGNSNPNPLTVTLWGTVAVLALISALIEYRRQNAQLPDASEPLMTAKASSVCQLPADVNDFTGRDTQIVRLQGILGPSTPTVGPKLVAIFGKGGVGKTALAIHSAHRLRQYYPDGQLYVNLRGFSGAPVKATEVLSGFLRALGVQGSAIPGDVNERASLFRSTLADRQVLVVLDNASAESQIRPVVPGSASCGVIITGRRFLGGIEGVVGIPVEVLDEPTALELLARIVGQERVELERTDAVRLVNLCGRLPLAVRIVGAQLAARPSWPIENLVARLGDKRATLRELRMGDLDVRASMELSLSELTADQQLGFRLLGLVRPREFSAWVLGPLLDVSVLESQRLIDQLVDAQLVEMLGSDAAGNPRYGLHDLIFLFAQELANLVPLGVQQEAISRLGGAYLTLTTSAEDRFQPGEVRVTGDSTRWSDDAEELRDYARDPVAWFTVERTSLLSMAKHAYEREMWSLTWEIAHSLAPFYELQAHWDDWREIDDLALLAARESMSAVGEAAILFDLGALHRDRGELDEATAVLGESLTKFDEAGDRHGRGLALIGMGVIKRNLEEWDVSAALLRESAEIMRACGDHRVAAQALRSLGIVLGAQGENNEAEQCFISAGAEFRTLGDRRATAYNDRNLGDLYRRTGRLDEAFSCFERSFVVCVAIGDRRGQAHALQGSARILAKRAKVGEAVGKLNEALRIIDGINDHILESSLRRDLTDLVS